jgi:hypothetical protein
MCRKGSSVYCFINGILQNIFQVTTAMADLGYPLRIGTNQGATGYFRGYISNVRVVKGTALYTKSYVVQNSSLTNISGTGFLFCNSSTIVDNGPFNYTPTITGSPSVSNKFPYTFGDVVPALSSGTSLLTLQNSTIVDNSVNGLALTVSGTLPTSNDTPIPLPSITSAASVPSIPGIPSANVVFLSAKSNRIKDSSIYNNSQVTITGSPKVTKFSPFPSTITVPISYSYKFESTSSTVRSKITPTDSVYQWPRLNSWTAEWWMNRTGRSGGSVYLLGSPYGGVGSPGIYFQNNSFTISNQGVVDIVTFVAPSSVNFNNNWNHVAVVKSTDTTSINPRYTLFVNGANIAPIEFDLDLIVLATASTESMLNSYSKFALTGEILLFNAMLTCEPVTDTLEILRAGAA